MSDLVGDADVFNELAHITQCLPEEEEFEVTFMDGHNQRYVLVCVPDMYIYMDSVYFTITRLGERLIQMRKSLVYLVYSCSI